MPIINFTFPPSALGLTVTVYRDDVSHSSGPLTDDVTDAGNLVYSIEADETSDVPSTRYTAQVSSALLGTLQTQGVLDTRASIADAPGAAETAYFVATGPTSLTDAVTRALTLIADPRQDALPAWVTIVDGEAVLGEDAGTCAFAVSGAFDIDFSETTPPESGDIYAQVAVSIDGGDEIVSVEAVTAADGEDDQSTGRANLGGLVVGSAITVLGAAYADGAVPDDGVATPRVALTITRLAPAPVLPE